MNKILRALSVMLLICFSSTVVLGQTEIENKVTLTPKSPIFIEEYVGIDTPTLNQDFRLHLETKYNGAAVTDVKIKDIGEFASLAPSQAEEKDGAVSGNVFTLRAPEKAGTYKIIFEGRTAQGQIFDFSTEIKVVESDPFQMWLRAGIIAGGVVCCALVVAVLSNR